MPSDPPPTARGRHAGRHEYDRAGAWASLAAWDVHRATLFGRCEVTTGKAPFDRLVAQVMTQPPYADARRVFWIVDNGSAHRGERAVARLREQYPHLVLVHAPIHASWLNQIEIYFSIVQRKVLTPNDFASLAEVEERRQVVALLEETLGSFGAVKTRAWGDLVSVELRREGRTVFSFQIAHRSAQLERLLPAPWGGVLLDSFPDLVADKMVALVERAAPRDFRDVHAICQAGLITPRECWALWARRQLAAGSDADPARARLAVETHLARIEQHRRLDQIADPRQRGEAARVRAWFGQELLNAVE